MTPDKIYQAILGSITKVRDVRVERDPDDADGGDELLDEMARNAAQAVVLLAEDSQGDMAAERLALAAERLKEVGIELRPDPTVIDGPVLTSFEDIYKEAEAIKAKGTPSTVTWGPTLAGEDISSDPLTRMNQIRQVMGLDELEPRFQSTVEREDHEARASRASTRAAMFTELTAVNQELGAWKLAAKMTGAIDEERSCRKTSPEDVLQLVKFLREQLTTAQRSQVALCEELTRLRAKLHAANSKLGAALNDASIANQRRDQAWKKGVLEANDKLYAAKISGVELSWDKIFELLNILLDHPLEES